MQGAETLQVNYVPARVGRTHASKEYESFWVLASELDSVQTTEFTSAAASAAPPALMAGLPVAAEA